ncbi:nuclear export mediator factor NEMF [Tanacetum coccineum]
MILKSNLNNPLLAFDKDLTLHMIQVLRDGVLYFLRDPVGPNYNPFRDIIDMKQERANGRRGDDDTLNDADKIAMEEDDIKEIGKDDKVKLPDVDYLTRNPFPNDNLTLMPVCAPYTALQSYQYT